MRDKSKFIAFILSAIPGLSHLYIGLKERALIFFMMFLGFSVGCTGLALLSRSTVFVVIFVIGYPIIWLISLLDMFSAWKSIEMKQLYNNENTSNITLDNKFNKKTVAMALAIVPGAGHMFLGYQRKGLIIMGAFFFSVFFMGWLGISLLLFLLPLIWFYSFFDTMHIVDGTKEEVKDQEFEFPTIKPEWIGFTLIGIGLVIILERILYPLIDYQIRRYIQTSIVSLIFIVIGIVILMKNKKQHTIVSDKEEVDENEE